MVAMIDVSETIQSRGRHFGQSEPAERDRLVSEHLPLVHRLARKFSQSGGPSDSLAQVGSAGLLKASQKYNPESDRAFAAFAIPVVVAEIKRYYRDHGWAVKLPLKLQTHRLAVDRTVQRLTGSLGRAPTIPGAHDKGYLGIHRAPHRADSGNL